MRVARDDVPPFPARFLFTKSPIPQQRLISTRSGLQSVPLHRDAPMSSSALAPTLEGLLEKKLELEQELAQLERQIFDLEGSYLEESTQFGNVLKGWEGFLNAAQLKNSGVKRAVKDGERMFSLSSVTSPLSSANEKHRKRDEKPSSKHTTPAAPSSKEHRRLSSSKKRRHGDSDDSD